MLILPIMLTMSLCVAKVATSNTTASTDAPGSTGNVSASTNAAPTSPFNVTSPLISAVSRDVGNCSTDSAGNVTIDCRDLDGCSTEMYTYNLAHPDIGKFVTVIETQSCEVKSPKCSTRSESRLANQSRDVLDFSSARLVFENGNHGSLLCNCDQDTCAKSSIRVTTSKDPTVTTRNVSAPTSTLLTPTLLTSSSSTGTASCPDISYGNVTLDCRDVDGCLTEIYTYELAHPDIGKFVAEIETQSCRAKNLKCSTRSESSLANQSREMLDFSRARFVFENRNHGRILCNKSTDRKYSFTTLVLTLFITSAAKFA